MELPKRKQNRLEDYDYSKSGTYFITVCVQDRKPILSHISANADSIYPPRMQLSFIGKIVENAIQAIPEHYQNISVDHYVIMPNHVHMLVRIEDDGGRAMLAPTTILRVIQQMKGAVVKQSGVSFWQKSFYDHVIRDDIDYQTKWKYIDDNPFRWREDEFYTESI